MTKNDLQKLSALCNQTIKLVTKMNKLQVFIAKCESNDEELKQLINDYVVALNKLNKENFTLGLGYEKRREEAIKISNIAKNLLLAQVETELEIINSGYQKAKVVNPKESIDLEKFLKFIVVEKLNMNWEQLRKEFKEGQR